MSVITKTQAPVVLEQASQEFVEATAKPPFLYELTPGDSPRIARPTSRTGSASPRHGKPQPGGAPHETHDRELPEEEPSQAGGPGCPAIRWGGAARRPVTEQPRRSPSRGSAPRVRIEGVVVGRQEYGVNVRLPDGTIQDFSDGEVSPAEPHEDQLRFN
jgi:hypothetical protein